MPLSAWLMMIFGCLVLYGGLTWCLSIAWRKSHDRASGREGSDADEIR
ncbi:MAG: MetS family NSS transporter small subunit [Candidatus Eisenbacteria bacterium]|nr:MetS family NSS transporter small subunit [Candidatus Eisenbacteria bacterium]